MRIKKNKKKRSESTTPLEDPHSDMDITEEQVDVKLEAESEEVEVCEAVSNMNTPQKSEKKMDRFASRA